MRSWCGESSVGGDGRSLAGRSRPHGRQRNSNGAALRGGVAAGDARLPAHRDRRPHDHRLAACRLSDWPDVSGQDGVGAAGQGAHTGQGAAGQAPGRRASGDAAKTADDAAVGVCAGLRRRGVNF